MTDEAQSISSTPFVSYAQNYEDVMLWRALRRVDHGFYIDAGAQSPETDSVTKAFSLLGWHGINIEPHPYYFEQLLNLRPRDVNLGVAVGETSGSLTMNLIEGSGLSTANEAFAEQHAAAGHAIRKHEVDMLTLTQVWEQHVPMGQPVHFLKVDVEGFERSVLAGNDWVRHRPWIVLVEATLPNTQIESHEEWEPILENAGYRFVYADGLNRFYVAFEHTELAEAFKYPPNVFDGFSTVLEASLREGELALRKDLDATQSALQQANEGVAVLVQGIDAERNALLQANERITVLVQGLDAERNAGQQANERIAALSQSLDAERNALLQANERVAVLVQSLDEERNARQQAQAALQQAEVQVSDLSREVVALERSLYESNRRIEHAEVSLIQAHERAATLQAETVALGHEVAERQEMLERVNRHASVVETQRDEALRQRDAITQQRDAITQQRDAIVQSVWWRITSPGRKLMTAVPLSVRRSIRRCAKGAWWLVTPWRIPARIRFLRDRGRALEADANASALNLYPSSASGQAAPPIEPLPSELTDRTVAARWCMSLLRSQPELRARFPRALTRPKDGFIDWLRQEGGNHFGLSQSSRSLVVDVLQEGFGARARQYYLGRSDVRSLVPDGLSPGGLGGLYRWFVLYGCAEGQISPEEVLWLAMEVSEETDEREKQGG
ncbi:FkbM family methyltransferase [Variovorax rhizosphaerae]|uniref:FkbM family methyltransferase n=1 Tax=Variovorax rhizosphaerae TaxID=1836200 RepID=A0ABU8WJV1_9BURK